MSFRIRGLSPEPFIPFFGLGERALALRGIVRIRVDESPGFPDRITLLDVPLGESVLLVNHVSLDAASPYRATHAIFVWEGARDRYDEENRVPEAMRRRLLSLRAFDARGMMRAADAVEGTQIEPVIETMFADEAVAVIHVHFAKPGCFAGEVTRA